MACLSVFLRHRLYQSFVLRDPAFVLVSLYARWGDVAFSFSHAARVMLERLKVTATLSRAHGVVVSHPLSMREALGSIPSVSIFAFVSRVTVVAGLVSRFAAAD